MKKESPIMLSKYLQRLTEKDYQKIANLVTNDTVAIQRILYNEKSVDIVLLSNLSFTIYDFVLSLPVGYQDNNQQIPDIHNSFIGYMYQRFGEEYLYDYYTMEYEIQEIEQQLEESKKCRDNAVQAFKVRYRKKNNKAEIIPSVSINYVYP